MGWRRAGSCARCVFNQKLPAKEQTRIKRGMNKEKQAERAAIIAFLLWRTIAEELGIVWGHNKGMREWIFKLNCFPCYFCVTAIINDCGWNRNQFSGPNSRFNRFQFFRRKLILFFVLTIFDRYTAFYTRGVKPVGQKR